MKPPTHHAMIDDVTGHRNWVKGIMKHLFKAPHSWTEQTQTNDYKSIWIAVNRSILHVLNEKSMFFSQKESNANERNQKWCQK